jgi:hypothetical protein
LPNWLLKEYADFFANPVCDILNSSFDEQALPATCKCHTTVKNESSYHNRQAHWTHLTNPGSKLAEEFIVRNYVGPAVLEIIDPNQFGAVPKSSWKSSTVLPNLLFP